MHLGDRLHDGVSGGLERGIGRQVPSDGRGRILALMIDGEWRIRFLKPRHRGERHLSGAARYALRRATPDKDAADIGWVLLELRIGFQDHAILVTLRENRRDLALGE